jgi:hypothetical protein
LVGKIWVILIGADGGKQFSASYAAQAAQRPDRTDQK